MTTPEALAAATAEAARTEQTDATRTEQTDATEPTEPTDATRTEQTDATEPTEPAPDVPGDELGEQVAPAGQDDAAGHEALIRVPIRAAAADGSVPAAGADEAAVVEAEWEQLPNGRWVVGDPGSQLTFVAKPSNKVQARADLAVDWATHGRIEYRAASIRGLGHFEDGKPRQDSYSVFFTQDRKWLVGCVADGVSSGTLSHAAADLACDSITRQLAVSLSVLDGRPTPESWPATVAELDWQRSVDAANRAIVEKATPTFEQKYRREGDSEALNRLQSEGPGYRDVAQLMATTAVAFVVGTDSASGDGSVPFAVLVAAGDSAAMILSDRRWHPITDVKNEGAAVASSAVHPLPREVKVQPRAGWLEAGQVLAVFTDGIGDPLGAGRGVVGRFLTARWSSPPDPLAFAGDLAFYRRTFVDDRTAALVWVHPVQPR